MPLINYVLIFITAAVSGAINSVAGGGTLLTFPVLVSVVGLDSKVANATNSMALWPASMAAAYSFRDKFAELKDHAVSFAMISVVGGAVGALLMNFTSSKQFDLIVPWLILLAAVLFVSNEAIMKKLGIKPTGDAVPDYTPRQWRVLLMFQFVVAIYGGYFGAGIGILMLASLSIMRFGDLIRINALKNMAAFLINLVCAMVFAVLGLVDWRVAIVMGVGACVGGFGGAGIARRIGARALRILISLIGFGVAAYYVLKNFGLI